MINQVKSKSEPLVVQEPGGFREGRGRVDQILHLNRFRGKEVVCFLSGLWCAWKTVTAAKFTRAASQTQEMAPPPFASPKDWN